MRRVVSHRLQSAGTGRSLGERNRRDRFDQRSFADTPLIVPIGNLWWPVSITV